MIHRGPRLPARGPSVAEGPVEVIQANGPVRVWNVEPRAEAVLLEVAAPCCGEQHGKEQVSG